LIPELGSVAIYWDTNGVESWNQHPKSDPRTRISPRILDQAGQPPAETKHVKFLFSQSGMEDALRSAVTSEEGAITKSGKNNSQVYYTVNRSSCGQIHRQGKCPPSCNMTKQHGWSHNLFLQRHAIWLCAFESG